ncbi:MAG: hypothetical protein CRN43_13705 [Candidatus Nephrothrix sp. EaCA]|nr:MAG: hypothetical protein CRN43_13705 [Candidatus Nephrothrix sp. EaCA]
MTPDIFTKHIVFEKLERLNQILASEEAKEWINIELRSFLEATYSYIKGRLNLTIPLLIQEAELEDIASEIELGNAQISFLIGIGDAVQTHLPQDYFNSALNKVKNLPFPLSKDDFDFSKAISSFQETVQSAYVRMGAANEKLQQDLKEAAAQSSDVITALKAKLEEARKIVNIVGNIGVTGNYQNIANQNKKTANFFRWVALFFMVVMSLLLIYSIIELSHDGFNLHKSLVRILAASVLVYPAVYAAKESARHRNLEIQNRNLELELASIGPFIEPLSEDKKQKIREDLANKYFGKSHTMFEDKKNDSEGVLVSELEKILKAIFTLHQKINETHHHRK